MKYVMLRFGINSRNNAAIVKEMAANGHELVVDIDLKKWAVPKISKWHNFVLLAFALYFGGKNWKKKYIGNPVAFKAMTKYCEKRLSNINKEYDFILLSQTLFMPFLAKPAKPYFIITDYNTKLAEKDGHFIFKDNTERNCYYKLESFAYQNATKIFPRSLKTYESFLDDYQLSVDKVKYIYTAINVQRNVPVFDKIYDGKTILFVGMDFKRKGGYVLLDSFKIIQETIPDSKLIITGCNPNISSKYDGLNIELIKGFSDRNTLKKLYTKAHVFAMPSYHEPIGLTYLEAMAFKIPCIGTITDNNKNYTITDGVDGYVCQKGDYKTTSERVIKLLKDKALSKKMGNAGYNKIEKHFTWDKVGNKICQEIEGSKPWS